MFIDYEGAHEISVIWAGTFVLVVDGRYIAGLRSIDEGVVFVCS